MYLSRLARAYIVGGEPERGAEAAMRALAIGCDTESARAFNELTAVDQAIAPWSAMPDVAEFRAVFRQARDRIATRSGLRP